MKCQVEEKEHFRHLLLFQFNRKVSAAEAARNIREVYGEDAMGESTARKWFSRFKEGCFDLNDASRSGRTSDFDEERLNALIHDNPRQSTRELADIMECDHSTIVRHLRSIGKVQKLGAWIPHSLTESNKTQRVAISTSLLSRHCLAEQRHQSFLSRIITGDEKWCIFVNFKQRKEWLSPNKVAAPRVKADLHPRKVLLCVWWDQEGVLHYELLPRNQTITAEVYCQQLRRLNNAIHEKRPGLRHDVLLLHDNARPHVARATKEVIEELGWEVLPHPPYSPDLAPSDFHLFRSLSNQLRGISFTDDPALDNWIDEFFASKSSNFFRSGIRKLPERWNEVINRGGDYIID